MRRTQIRSVVLASLGLGLLVLVPASAGAAPILSDVLSVTFDGVNITRSIVEQPGESVTEEIDFHLFPTTNQFDSLREIFAYLVEPDQPYTDNLDGTFTGFRSDYVRLQVSNEHDPAFSDLVTELHFTINSDEDPGTHAGVTGLLETGLPQDITALLFGAGATFDSTTGFWTGGTLGTHTALVLVTSDAETTPVPEPASLLLLGTGLVGLGGTIRRRRR